MLHVSKCRFDRTRPRVGREREREREREGWRREARQSGLTEGGEERKE